MDIRSMLVLPAGVTPTGILRRRVSFCGASKSQWRQTATASASITYSLRFLTTSLARHGSTTTITASVGIVRIFVLKRYLFRHWFGHCHFTLTIFIVIFLALQRITLERALSQHRSLHYHPNTNGDANCRHPVTLMSPVFAIRVFCFRVVKWTFDKNYSAPPHPFRDRK